MTTREEIENRLGIFARRALFDNCGIGPNGFEPGNDCGGKPSSGGSESKPAPKSGRKAAKTDKTAKGIEERAKAAGKTFTEQYLEETRGGIDRDYEDRERKASDAEQRKADARVRKAETALEEAKARGPERTDRARAVDRSIAEIDRKLADIAKEREDRKAADEARQAANATASAERDARIADAKRKLAELKQRGRSLRI
jgi:hypothetical protein